MKLISTLRYSSATPTAPGTRNYGNYGGDLRLFFTRLNPDDFKPTPPIVWQGVNKGASDTYKLPNGSEIAMNLNTCTGVPPGRFGIYGTIIAKTANGISSPVSPIGDEDAASFLPGHPT
jgi:hypothetical protein